MIAARRRRWAAALSLWLAACATAPPPPPGSPRPARLEQGLASWYGPEIRRGSPTASGEPYRPADYTAAHRSLPFGTRVLVENLANHRRVVVRINDRGPFVAGRVIDLSAAAARAIDLIDAGVAPVRLLIIP